MAAKKESVSVQRQSDELLRPEVRAKLEETYGAENVFALKHPDGTVFAFRRALRKDVAQFRARQRREDEEATERLLRECVIGAPDISDVGLARAAFSQHLERRALSVAAFSVAFMKAQGGGGVFDADSSDLGGIDVEGTESKHGEVNWVVSKGGEVYGFTIPSQVQVRRFQAEIRKKNYSALEEILLNPNVVYPPPAQFASFIELNLFAIEELGDKLAELGGLGEGATSVGK